MADEDEADPGVIKSSDDKKAVVNWFRKYNGGEWADLKTTFKDLSGQLAQPSDGCTPGELWRWSSWCSSRCSAVLHPPP